VERYVFYSSIDDDKTAWMNVGGRDVKLMLEKETGLKGKEEERVGRPITGIVCIR